MRCLRGRGSDVISKGWTSFVFQLGDFSFILSQPVTFSYKILDEKSRGVWRIEQLEKC